jgi:hypothetical protein
MEHRGIPNPVSYIWYLNRLPLTTAVVYNDIIKT